MKHSLTLALLVGSAAFGLHLATAQAGGSGPTAQTGTSSATATLQANGTVVTTGIRLPGQGLTLQAGCAGAANQTARVVCAANAFLATLNAPQQAQVLLPMTRANAVKWSNLPCGNRCRNGVQFSTLSTAQLAAAQAVVKAAMGTVPDNGYSEAMQILMADDVLNASGGMGGPNGAGGTGGPPPLPSDDAGTGQGGPLPGGSPPDGAPPAGGPGGGGGYSSGTYCLAFLGTPSATGTWQLQFGGHHLAVNTTFKAGQVASATPEFTGVEPRTWTANGTTYAPLAGERNGMAAMIAGLNSTQLTAAKLPQIFSNVLPGPNQDGKFPQAKAGVRVSTLSAAQQALVPAAMKPWVQDTDDATAARLLAVYQNELKDTYVAYSGNASLTSHADYVRIDGPSVWIEFVCQSGVVYRSQIHYHTVWRDHQRDYGAEYKF